jgi:hypothetical protein
LLDLGHRCFAEQDQRTGEWQRPITADTALWFGMFFGMERRFGLNLQSEYDIRVADRELRAKLSPRIRVFQPVAGWCARLRDALSRLNAGRGRRLASALQEPIDLDRCRQVTLEQIARKPAPILMPDGLTVRMTVKLSHTAQSAVQING